MAKGEKKRLVGHIEKRGEGKYRLTVSAGSDSSGERIRKRRTVQAVDDAAAEVELAKFITEIEGGMYFEPSKLTFKTFVDRWLDDYANNPSVYTPRSLYRNQEMLETRILPEFGEMQITKIKPLHIVSFESKLRKDGARKDKKKGGLAESTIAKYHWLLSAIFKTAEQWGVIEKNPVEKVTPPKVKKSKPPKYEEKEVAAMLAALEKEPLKYRVIVHLAFASGMRRGELMALTWEDIDFKSNTLDISKALQYVPKEGVSESDPKTEESIRIVTLPQATIDLLKQYRVEQVKQRLKVGDLWKGSDRIFTTWDGGGMFPDTPTQWFPKFLKRHSLPHLNFHGLRHLNATFLIAQGVNIKTVSSRLGHAEVKTTLDIYTAALRSADRDAADKLDSIFTVQSEIKGVSPKCPQN
jgi:integrase